MHLGMPECHKPFLGHCDLDLWPRFQELLCPEHISYIIWCRNPKFGVVIPLGMAEWCIPFWVTLTLTLTSGLISNFFVLYYSYLPSNVSYTRPIPLGAFVTCLWHFLFDQVSYFFHKKIDEVSLLVVFFDQVLYSTYSRIRQKGFRRKVLHRQPVYDNKKTTTKIEPCPSKDSYQSVHQLLTLKAPPINCRRQLQTWPLFQK